MNTPESLSGVVSDLIRRGLPVDYAERAAAEFTDHHRDLVEELQAAGWSDSQASTEASRRLGDLRALTKKTAREYQRRHWCARWPFLTFLLAPIPTVVAAWIATGYSILGVIKVLGLLGCAGVNEHTSDVSSPGVRIFLFSFVVWCLLAVPAIVSLGFARLARRAALHWRWVAITACIVGIGVGTVRFERVAEGKNFRTVYDSAGKPLPKNQYIVSVPLFEPSFWSGRSLFRWYTHGVLQPFQLLLPSMVGALVLLRCQQLSRRTMRLHLADC
jgi:hypothetical protein